VLGLLYANGDVGICFDYLDSCNTSLSCQGNMNEMFMCSGDSTGLVNNWIDVLCGSDSTGELDHVWLHDLALSFLTLVGDSVVL
jgi:hypothetical protein